MKPIRFYGLSYCIHCKNAKAYFDRNNIPYDLVYVDELEGKDKASVLEEVRQHNPALSFPTLLINGSVVVGFDEKRIGAALSG